MNPNRMITRRIALRSLSLAGAALAAFPTATLGAGVRARGGDLKTGGSRLRRDLLDRICRTPMVDTHEHLLDERERLQSPRHPRVPCDDWAVLFSHYLDSDLVSAGMPRADRARFLSPEVDPADKWKLLAPHWPSVRHTGYARAVQLAIRELYGVDELSAQTVARVQAGYERVRRPGFYGRILEELAGIESCQVNCLTGEPFKRSAMPMLLMQDLSIAGMFMGPNLAAYAGPTGIRVTALADWHRVIEWWFDHTARYAVAVKTQHAYNRDLDHARVPAEAVEGIFQKVLQKDPVNAGERRQLEDHLFWHAVDLATRHGLPVKLHTGYYAGENSMPLARVRANAGSAAELCRLSPATKFVFMHICYPFYEEILAVAKQWTNATVDMCWSWIINPVAAKDYVKKHLVTAPINKLLPFGGDYIPVEPVLGHAILARRGLATALAELVDEGLLTPGEAGDAIAPILHGNARELFQIARKREALRSADWVAAAPE